MITRFMAVVAYDGSKYSGFQIQPESPSIQGTLQETLSRITKQPSTIVGAGRTDAGVHAKGQTFHFDSSLSLTPDEWKKAFNSLLPDSIYIRSVCEKTVDFHARFSAKGKWYQYRISFGEYDPLLANYVYHYPFPLDIDLMEQGAKLFLGTHCFQNFCTNHEEGIEMTKTLSDFSFHKENETLVIDIRGTGFLRYMVRLMVGTLIEVGRHHYTLDEIKKRLDTNELIPSVYKAPAQGLYLMEVYYS